MFVFQELSISHPTPPGYGWIVALLLTLSRTFRFEHHGFIKRFFHFFHCLMSSRVINCARVCDFFLLYGVFEKLLRCFFLFAHHFFLRSRTAQNLKILYTTLSVKSTVFYSSRIYARNVAYPPKADSPRAGNKDKITKIKSAHFSEPILGGFYRVSPRFKQAFLWIDMLRQNRYTHKL